MNPGIVPSVLVFVALVLFFASQMSGYIKRALRHPQMIGTIVWAVSHLLTNGDSRSVILFGTLGIWALLEMSYIQSATIFQRSSGGRLLASRIN